MNLHLEPSQLITLIRSIAAETAAVIHEHHARSDGRLTLTEAEAAYQLGLSERQLADERRRGRITASSIVGRRIRYLRQDLVDYMLRRRVGDV